MQIRIRYSEVLDGLFRKLQDQNYPDPDLVSEKTEQFKEVWGNHEKDILQALQKVLGLNFFHQTVDVFVVGKVPNSISTPTIIHMNMDDDRFLYVLTHELIHVLLSDNSEGRLFGKRIESLYPDEPKLVRNHVAVHSVLEIIFTDYIPKPDLLNNDKRISQDKPAYKKAWDIVERDNAQNILTQILKE